MGLIDDFAAFVQEHRQCEGLRGGEPSLAIDSLLRAERPTEMAQAVLNDLPIFPL